MTIKKDLKKRVRDRQVRTGESYTTALEQILAQRREIGSELVVEMADGSAEAARLGLQCRQVHISPRVIASIASGHLLEQLRDTLIATKEDPLTARFRSVLLRGDRPAAPPVIREMILEFRAFMVRVQAGIGGASAQGNMLALQVRSQKGPMTVVCALRFAPDPLPTFLAAHADAIRDRYPALVLGTAEELIESRGIVPWL